MAGFRVQGVWAQGHGHAPASGVAEVVVGDAGLDCHEACMCLDGVGVHTAQELYCTRGNLQVINPMPARREHLFTSSGWLVHAGTAGSACRCTTSSHLQAWADHLQAGRSLMLAPHKCIF